MNRRILIEKKSILFFLLMLCFTAVYGTNYWFSGLYINDFMVVTSLVLSLFTFIYVRFKILHSNYKLVILLTLIMWISGIMVASKYELPFSVILKESLYTIVPLMVYFAFRPLLRTAQSVSLFLKSILVSGFLSNIFALVSMSFALNGIDLLRMNVFDKVRNGLPRFTIAETVVVLGFFISCSILANKQSSINKKILHIINILLTVINLFWIMKTRTLSLYILATLFMIPFFKKGITKSKKVLSGILVLSTLLFVLFSYFIPSLNSLIDSDYGVQVRFSMINYYLDFFKEHWLFGSGYISANPYYSTYYIVAGPYGRFYTSDVGVIGLMFKNGIIGLMWLATLFYSSIKIIRNNTKWVPNYYDMLMKLFVVFLIFSCINLILTDTPRFPYIAFVMLIIDSSYVFRNVPKNDNSRN